MESQNNALSSSQLNVNRVAVGILDTHSVFGGSGRLIGSAITTQCERHGDASGWVDLDGRSSIPKH